MRAIMESAFDIAYLVTAVVLGCMLLHRSKVRKNILLFGIMSLLLVFGDAFHLVPRIVGLNSPQGLEGYTAALGIGTLVTSVTMTVFYVIFYHFCLMTFDVEEKKPLTWIVWLMAIFRIVLCLFPQNQWIQSDAPVIWGIYRNIPFTVLGVIIAVLLFQIRKQKKSFRLAWLAVTLSFAFYIPVVLWADVSPLVGMLMLPKTICYVWLMVMGYRYTKE